MAQVMLVDSSVWIDHFNGAHNRPVDWLRAAFCVKQRVTLLHNDRGFKPLAAHCGLREIVL